MTGRRTGWADWETLQLLAAHTQILNELRSRGAVRTGNAPLGDYAEGLILAVLGGSLATSTAQKSFDVLDSDGQRVQVKARSYRPTETAKPCSPFRSFDFDVAAFVLLERETYLVRAGFVVPVASVEAACRHVPHVNGWRLTMSISRLTALEGARDITESLRAAQQGPHVGVEK